MEDVYVISKIVYGHDELNGKDYMYVDCLGVYEDKKEALEEFDRMVKLRTKEFGVVVYENIKDIKWDKTHTRVDFKAFNIDFKHNVNVTIVLKHSYMKK